MINLRGLDAVTQIAMTGHVSKNIRSDRTRCRTGFSIIPEDGSSGRPLVRLRSELRFGKEEDSRELVNFLFRLCSDIELRNKFVRGCALRGG